MPPAAFPKDLRALTSLRFWAALWVVIFHCRGHLGLEAAALPLIMKGHLGVDFFFVLSGFILAHVYRDSLGNGSYRHSGFVRKRLARIYPMHIVTLAFFVVVVLIAPLAGLSLDTDGRYNFEELPEHALLIHAWIGTGQEFNYPSWSISAEFFAYLCFPLVMMLARRPRLMVLMGLLAVFGWYLVASITTGRSSTTLADWLIMRIMPEFLLGAGLREIMAQTRIPGLTSRHATFGAAAMVVGAW